MLHVPWSLQTAEEQRSTPRWERCNLLSMSVSFRDSASKSRRWSTNICVATTRERERVTTVVPRLLTELWSNPNHCRWRWTRIVGWNRVRLVYGECIWNRHSNERWQEDNESSQWYEKDSDSSYVVRFDRETSKTDRSSPDERPERSIWIRLTDRGNPTASSTDNRCRIEWCSCSNVAVWSGQFGERLLPGRPSESWTWCPLDRENHKNNRRQTKCAGCSRTTHGRRNGRWWSRSCREKPDWWSMSTSRPIDHSDRRWRWIGGMMASVAPSMDWDRTFQSALWYLVDALYATVSTDGCSHLRRDSLGTMNTRGTFDLPW